MTNDSKAGDAVSGAQAPGEHDVAAIPAGPTKMRHLGGSFSDAFNTLIARQTAAALYFNPQNDEDRLSKAHAALVEALDHRRGEGSHKTVTVEHRVMRLESEAQAQPAPRLGAPQISTHIGNGHALNGHAALNGHTAPGGAALS